MPNDFDLTKKNAIYLGGRGGGLGDLRLAEGVGYLLLLLIIMNNSLFLIYQFFIFYNKNQRVMM